MLALIINNMRSIPILLLVAGLSFGDRYAPIERAVKDGTSRAPVVDILSTPVSINVRNVALPYLLSLISQEVKYPIVLRDIAYPLAGQVQTQTQTQTPQTPMPQASQTQTAQSEYLTVSYFADKKPLRQVLDEITGTLDLWWKKEDGRIVIYKYESRSYRLALPFLQKKIDEKKDSLTVSYQREFTKNLEQSLQKFLSDPQSKVAVDEMGNVFVRARPSEISAIENAIRSINSTFTKEIPLKVRVYLVNDTDFTALGFSFSRQMGDVSSSLGTTLANPIFTISLATTRLQANLLALAQSGKATILEESMLSALNGQPIVYAPLQKQRIISQFNLSYVSAGSSSPATPTITTQTEDVSSGSVMIIVPYYVDEETIAVDLYRRQDTVERIDSKRIDLSGFQNEVALPVVSSRTNVNQTIMKRGQTLMLFSSAQTLEQFKDIGIPFLKDIPVLGYLFSTKEKTKELYRLVITITFGRDEAGE